MFNRNYMLPPFNNPYSILPKAKFNWGSLLTNAQKTLGVINQAIPVFHQVRPIWSNAKTMFKVMGEMGKINNNNNNNRGNNSDQNTNTTTVNNQNNQQTFQNNEPNFFI
ncbi:MAG: VrrA/YqfQ family protein [Bacilli bacterium]|nr:VrrA/YqfQ family protein [Bacilli bacterium]